MGARSPYTPTPTCDLEAFIAARDLAHRGRREPGPVRAAFLEWGRFRWLIVPLAALGFAALVAFVASLPGIAA